MKTIMTLLILLISAVVAGQCVDTPTVDYAGKTYNTVQIGTQCWLKENLNIGTRIDGKKIATKGNIDIEKYCYGNLESNCDIYGGLYSWDEAMQYSNTESSQGICPAGWHIPSLADYQELYTILGGQLDVYTDGIWVQGGAGCKMKEPGFLYWNPLSKAIYTNPSYYNTGLVSNNSSGFSARGSGIGWHNGNFYYLKIDFDIWLSSEVNSSTAYNGGATYATGSALEGQFYKSEKLAIRCIKD